MNLKSAFVLVFSLMIPPHVCAGQNPPNPEPLPIPHPSMATAGSVVKSHIEEERRRFDEVIGANPRAAPAQLARAYSGLARVYHTYGFSDAALACYLNLDRIQPGIYPCLYAIGWIHQRQGRQDEALRYLVEARAIAQRRPDTPPSVVVAMNCLIGEAQFNLNDFANALKTFREAVELDPRCAYAWNGMGLVYSVQGNSKQAIECIERAIQLQPNASAGRVILAREYRKAGLSAKAAGVLPKLDDHRTTPFWFYDPIIARDVAPLNRSAATLQTRALKARQQGNLQLAIELLQEAIQSNPSLTSAKANLASAYLKLNQLEDAEALSRQIVDEQPENASFHDLLGAALFKRGKFDEALRSFERAHELDPDQGTHSFWSGAVLSWQGKHDQALAMFDRAVRLSPSNADAHIGAAIMVYRLGNVSDALNRLQRCIELFPRSTEARFNLARLLSAHPELTEHQAQTALALALPALDQLQSTESAASGAMAYAASGNYKRAIELQQRAIAHAAEQGHEFDVPWLKRNLRLYEADKPSREPWNMDRGYPSIEGMVADDARP